MSSPSLPSEVDAIETASTQKAKSIVATDTTTPRARSIPPSRRRWRNWAKRRPESRPRTDNRVVTASTVTRVTVSLAAALDTSVAVRGAMVAPAKRPKTVPTPTPNCVATPVAHPHIAAATRPMTMKRSS
jgi:hypothetical protein